MELNHETTCHNSFGNCIGSRRCERSGICPHRSSGGTRGAAASSTQRAAYLGERFLSLGRKELHLGAGVLGATAAAARALGARPLGAWAQRLLLDRRTLALGKRAGNTACFRLGLLYLHFVRLPGFGSGAWVSKCL
jgi:hypothetical protein